MKKTEAILVLFTKSTDNVLLLSTRITGVDSIDFTGKFTLYSKINLLNIAVYYL